MKSLKKYMKILHIVMMKLIFNMQYFNFDDMVCSDRSFFRLNTKMANSCRLPSGPGARGAYHFLPNDDGWL